MGRLLRENVRPYAGWIAVAVFFMIVMAAAASASAYLMKHVVNDVFIAKNAKMLWITSGTVMGAFLLKGLSNYAQSVIMSRVGLRIIADNQKCLYNHLSGMDIAFFHAHSTGGLVTRFNVDINQMRVAVSNALTSFGRDTFSLIGLVSVMFYQDLQLALIAFVVFPAAVYPITRLGKRMRKVTANTQQEMGQLATLLDQTFQGVRVVKAYGMEPYERGRVADIAERIFGLTYKSAKTRSMASPIMETLGGAAVAVVIVYGGYQVIYGTMDPGSFFSFITALLMAYEPLKRLANLNSSVQEGLAGAQRLFALLDARPTILEKPDAHALTVDGGAIELEDARFAYEPGKPALNGVTMDVPAGKTVALVGPSGAGKSTILNLIPRFYDLEQGRVTVDGHDVRELTFASLRSACALVSQEVTLFDDTVRANIAYGKEGASEDEIIAAAKHAAAHDFITELSDGYDTMVGEHGVKLSGGQRQRLAIARAMLRNAPILLLDEATSALDTESERHVQSALETLMEGRTTLVIAHRLSTVVNADLIYVIDQGRIIESGTHAELLDKGGAYAHLYSLQFSEQEDQEAAQ